jgi:hypothetical protein
MNNLQRAKLTGLSKNLHWHEDVNRKQFYLDFNPVMVLMVYQARNSEGKVKWFGRIMASKVVDIYDQFDDLNQCQFFTISLAQTIILDIDKILRTNSQDIH